jgi:hypothetical protein
MLYWLYLTLITGARKVLGRPGVWAYRDRSLEKDQRFSVNLSESGPDNPKRIVAQGGTVILHCP